MKLHFFYKKPGLLILTFLLASVYLKAQNPTYSQIISIISAKAPGLDISNKVIGFTAWSSSNTQSRIMNREFNRVEKIYQGAKLRNGSKGDIMISCNMDNASTGAIFATKDGIDFAININKADFAFLSNIAVNTNVVYDNTGTKIYENLSQEQVFMSFNQLITR